MAYDLGATRRIARVALGLFVAGLLLPFVVYAILVSRLLEMPHQKAVNVAAVVGAVCELSAFISGVIGWRHPTGKVAVIGSCLLIGLVMFAATAWVFR